MKPENVIFTNGEVKLIDFGSSAFSGKQGEIEGTIMYMAPEVLYGDYFESSDMWGIGLITYILLAGAFPFAYD